MLNEKPKNLKHEHEFVTRDQVLEIVQPQSINKLNNFAISVKIKCVPQITSTHIQKRNQIKEYLIVQPTCKISLYMHLYLNH